MHSVKSTFLKTEPQIRILEMVCPTAVGKEVFTQTLALIPAGHRIMPMAGADLEETEICSNASEETHTN